MRNSIVAWFVVLAMAATASPGTTQESVELRYAFEVGDTHRSRIVTRQDATQSIMGQEQQTRSTNTVIARTTVLEIDGEGAALIETTYERFQVSVSSPMMSFEYDSDDPPETVPMMARPYAALAGASMTWRVSPQGAVSDMTGLGDIFDNVFEEAGLPAEAADEMREGLDDMVGGLGSTLPPFPTGSISVGDSWDRSLQGADNPLMDMETTMTLVGLEDGRAIIEMRAVSPGRETVREMAGMVMRSTLSGEHVGTMEIELATGWPVRMRNEGEMSGDIVIEGMPGMTESMPMSTKMVMTMERIGNE